MRSRASSLIIVSSPFTREDTYLNTTIKREMVHFWGSPSILGIAEFIVPTGSFFPAQTHVSFHIIAELSPNMRMISVYVIKNETTGPHFHEQKHPFPLAILLVEYIDLILLHVHQSKTSHS